MADTVSPGTPVVVMQRSVSPPVQHQATLASTRELVVALRLASPTVFHSGEDVLLVAGELGARKVVSARFAMVRDDVAVFRMLREWQDFDPRAHPRLPADITAEIRSVLGTSRQSARVIDVSLGGLGVEVATKPGGREMEVHLTVEGFAARLPCEIVNAESTDGGVLLHLRFAELTPVQHAFVRNMVGSLGKPERGSGQRLAS